MDQFQTYALKCPRCGASLEVAANLHAFACAYCGSSVLVNRSGGAISLALEGVINEVRRGTDKTAAELAIRRISDDLSSSYQRKKVLLEQKEAVESVSSRHYLEVKRRSSFWPLTIIAITIFTIGNAIGGDLGPYLGVAAAIAISVYVYRTIERGKERRLRALRKSRTDRLAEIDTALENLDRAIEASNQKLVKNRAIVDA